MAPFYTRRIGTAQYASYSDLVQIAGMSDQHERLKEVRAKAGYPSAAAAARAMGIKPAGYSHHENGTRDYDFETAERYAAFFKTTPEWLMGGRQKIVNENGPRQAREVAQLSWVAAGRLGPVSPLESADVRRRIKVENLPPGDWVALEVEGRSMERIAPEKSTILVNRSDRTLVSGKFYVIVSHAGEASFKRFKAGPPRFLPYTLDPDEEPIYPDHEPENEWDVFGRVHRVLIDL